MIRVRLGWLAGLAVLAAGAAAAQERSPAERQAMVDLSRVLGESHAISQACAGAQDQSWRDRMQQLLDVEAADQGLKTRLSVAFNEGYHSGQALFPSCSAAARVEARHIAGKGEALARSLAGP